jgi:hypothetical protein
MIVLTLAVGFILGWFALRALINLKMKRMLDSIVNSPIPEKKTINLDFVKMHHAILAYNRDTQQFLVQGSTREEITALLLKRFPDTSFMANTKNLEEVDLK